MPKIIQNLEQKLLEETVRQIQEYGYTATTIRSVAKACGVGVGTVYNYFPSKEALLAAYMLSDWRKCMASIEAVSTYCGAPKPVARCIWDQLVLFARRHESIFRDEGAAALFHGSLGPYHAMLRGQLAAPLRQFCADDFTAEFIAESLLVWSMAGKDFETVYAMVEKLFFHEKP